MVDERKGECEICYEEASLFIDHCHETGNLRGLLCSPCNLSLGGFKDSVQLLEQAINYLNRERQLMKAGEY